MGDYELIRSDGCTVTGRLVDGRVDGEVVVRWPTGEIKSRKSYAMNTPIGIHTRWDEDGEVIETITYEDGIPVLVNGEPPPRPDDEPPPTPGGDGGNV